MLAAVFDFIRLAKSKANFEAIQYLSRIHTDFYPAPATYNNRASLKQHEALMISHSRLPRLMRSEPPSSVTWHTNYGGGPSSREVEIAG